jgi:hypothetical protein
MPRRDGQPIRVVNHMDTAAKRRLGDIFVDRGLITDGQLQQALTRQRETSGKLGEVLVELGFITRVELAGVISEQWDELRVSQRGQKTAQMEQRRATAGGSSVVESALRERLEQLTAELTVRDQRIAQQDATIAALIAQLGGAAA